MENYAIKTHICLQKSKKPPLPGIVSGRGGVCLSFAVGVGLAVGCIVNGCCDRCRLLRDHHIEADWVQIHLDEIEISDIILPADTSGVYLYIDDVAGKQYVCLRGTLKNLSSVNLDSDEMGGKVVINDTYEYDIEMSIGANPAATTDYLLEPLGTSHFYIYANVPDDALALMKTGYMLLDFNENFGVTNGTGDYYYRIDFAK